MRGNAASVAAPTWRCAREPMSQRGATATGKSRGGIRRVGRTCRAIHEVRDGRATRLSTLDLDKPKRKTGSTGWKPGRFSTSLLCQFKERQRRVCGAGAHLCLSTSHCFQSNRDWASIGRNPMALTLLFSLPIQREKKQKRKIGADERTRTSTDCSTTTSR